MIQTKLINLTESAEKHILQSTDSHTLRRVIENHTENFPHSICSRPDLGS